MATIKLPDNTTIYDIDVYINGNKLTKTYESIFVNVESYQNSNKNVSVYSGEDYDIELKYSKAEEPICYIVGKKIGANNNIVFKIDSNGKKYETSLKVKVTDADFRFALEKNRIKEYTGKYAFVIGEEDAFKLNLPSGYTMDDVTFNKIDNNDCIEINQDKKTITAKKVGHGRLAFILKKDGVDQVVSYTNFEVVEKLNKNNSSSNSSSSSNTTTSSSKNESGIKKLKFSEDKRIITLTTNTVKIYETPVTNGIKKDEINYSVSDTSIASVVRESNSNRAVINIKKTGSFVLTATYKDIKAEKEIVVHANSLDIFKKGKNTKINNEDVSLNIGETLELDTLESENKLDTSLLKYTSSNEKICKIDENGKITALKKGGSVIKVMLKENSKTYARFYVKVSASKEEKMLSQTFSFPQDENGKVIAAKGENALVVGKTYTYNLVKPEGAENYEVTYECSKSDLLEINGEKITAIKAGKGNLVAKIKIGNNTKTASMPFEIFATETEKNEEKAETVKYLTIEFTNKNMVIEKGKTSTLKPSITTNMKKSEYSLEWSSSNEKVAKVDKNGKLTTLAVGNTTITVQSAKDSNIKSTLEVEVKEKVILVTSLKFNTNLEKNGSTYLINTNEYVTMNFSVIPENATLKDYTIEVADKENFIVEGNKVIALKEGVTTKLTARASDSGNKFTTITLKSVMSDEEVENLQLITDNEEITVKVGESLKFKKPEKTSISKSGNISYKTDSNVVIITGNKLGTGEIRIKQSNKVISTIKVNIVAQKSTESDVAVKNIELPIDSKTLQPKNYTTDYPLVVDKCYNIIDTLAIYPANATNKSINVEVSDKNAFTVTPEGNIIANKSDATALVTLTSVSNPDVVTTFNIASVNASIKNIKFAKDYIGNENLTLDQVWGFNLIIDLDNGQTFDPATMSNPYNNKEYQKYLSQIALESSDTSLLEIDNSMNARVVVGKNGTGTLSAYVKSNPNVKTTAKFETVGINEDTKIKTAKFVKENYEITLDEGETEFCPMITLANNHIYDPSKDYGSTNSVAGSDDYRNYIEQLKLEIVKTNSSNGVLKIVDNKDGRKLSVMPQKVGTCQIVLKLKSTNEEVSRITVEVKKASETTSNSGVSATVTEINHATTTSNRNLKITDIKFYERSYTITENYAVAFQPIIKLSDGSTINHQSEDKDTYLYYVSQTELYFTNESDQSAIDFGIAKIINTDVPRAILALKNGKFNLAIGLKSSTSQTIYDVVPVTVKIQ